MWNKDEVKGKGKQITGAIKDKVGEMTNNPRLEAEGEAEHSEGIVQQKVGKGRRKIGEVVEKAGKVIAGKR
ncbi:MAG: CsbD family protein [Acidobacteriota bacterium]